MKLNMTNEEFVEVKEALNQEYTLDEIYWKIANLKWSQEMFVFFINELSREQRKR
jgi:hypothetical protein